MPSKGGSRGAGGAVPLAEALAAAMVPAVPVSSPTAQLPIERAIEQWMTALLSAARTSRR